MPDTMISQPDTPTAAPPACGVMNGYRSPSIGKLVAARAKSSSKIKAIIKAKKATVESRREGGRGYQYAYADLADVLEAVEDAISEQGMAIFQVTQDRGRDGTYLVTTLSHESDQWIAGEVRLRNTEGGPQVLGSELTYLRRYAVLAALALAPESDDDGKAAQDRADQQARQRPAQRTEPSHPSPTPAPSKTAQDASSEPQHMAMAIGSDGPFIGRWTRQALETLEGRPEAWRCSWLELHTAELEEVRHSKPEYADRIEAAAIAPDAPADKTAP